MNPGSCCWRKGDPFQGLRVDSCLPPGNELSKETHVLIKQKTLLGRAAKAGKQQGREPGTALPRGSQSQVLCFWISFQVVFGQSFCLARIWSGLRSFLVAHASLSQDGFQCEGFWEVGRTILWAGVSSFLLAPPRSSQLVFSGSTLFVIRTSSCETTQASSYHCSWPRRAVLVSSSLTI